MLTCTVMPGSPPQGYPGGHRAGQPSASGSACLPLDAQGLMPPRPVGPLLTATKAPQCPGNSWAGWPPAKRPGAQRLEVAPWHGAPPPPLLSLLAPLGRALNRRKRLNFPPAPSVPPSQMLKLGPCSNPSSHILSPPQPVLHLFPKYIQYPVCAHAEFPAARSTTATEWKQSKCPPTTEHTHKM